LRQTLGILNFALFAFCDLFSFQRTFSGTKNFRFSPPKYMQKYDDLVRQHATLLSLGYARVSSCVLNLVSLHPPASQNLITKPNTDHLLLLRKESP